MMREIKFRAWDKKRKEWYGANNPYSLTFYDFHIFGECTLLCPPDASDLADLDITQFTGLKDKNGNGAQEVYECDIIDIDGNIKGNIYEVEPEEADLIIPGIGTKAWEDAYKKAVERGFNYAE